jgi:hypothetical protein
VSIDESVPERRQSERLAQHLEAGGTYGLLVFAAGNPTD